jgi:polysaccharide export outer membrane protein
VRIAIALLAVLATSPASADPPSVPVEDPSYRVDVRDLLDIEVYGEPDLSGPVVVGQGGVVDVPLVGRIEVGGRTTLAIADAIRAVLAERYLVNPQVTVRVGSYASQPVQVLGAVKKPGVYYLTGETRVLEILAQAGDIDSEHSIKELHIRRAAAPQDTVVVSLEGLVSRGEGNVLLHAGDVVYVPEGLVVYVAGQVEEPGEIPYSEGLTVTQALTMARGPTQFASLKLAYILRQGTRITIPLRAIMRGRETDIVLEPGDQLFVKESVF